MSVDLRVVNFICVLLEQQKQQQQNVYIINEKR